MKIIRDNIFETNSSSTHALVVPKQIKQEGYSLSIDWELRDAFRDNRMTFEYGRCLLEIYEDWTNKLAYTYIVLRHYNDFEKNAFSEDSLNNFRILINNLYCEVYEAVEYKPYDDDPKPDDIFNFIDKDYDKQGYDCWVDHVAEVPREFLDKVIFDKDFAKRFIFNKDSYITIGGDEYQGFYIRKVGFENDYGDTYEEDNEWSRKLDELEKDFDIYLKGN